MELRLRRQVMAWVALVLAVSCLAATAPAGAGEEWSRPLEVGEVAPDFILVGSHGKAVQLSRYAQGRYVILDFYMGWF